MKRFIAKHSPLFLLLGLCVLLALLSEEFRSMQNLRSVVYRNAAIGIIAVGELLVVLTAGIDLSVGSVAALSAVLGCLSMKTFEAQGIPCPVTLGVGIGMLVGLLCGTINGILTTKGRIPPFIVTLGMMMAARGLTMIFSGAQSIYGFPASFAGLGGTTHWWIPVVITVSITGCFAIILNHTRFGRALYATGGNLQAARLSGINVDRVRTFAFALCGLLSGFAGVMLASRTSVAMPNAAEIYELYAIAACVIGGASLMGGEGGALGCLAGALIMAVLRNYCNLEDINPHWQQVLVGSLLILLIFYDNYRKRKAGLLVE